MSNRITKDEAYTLATKLVSVKKDGVELLKQQYRKKVYELYVASIPKEVLTFHQKHPTFFVTADSIKVDSYGFSREWVDCPEKMFVIEQNGGSELKLTRETASELIKVKRIWEKEKELVEKTKNEIKNALINLHTYKRIIEQFPEAEPLLPKKYSPPAVNYNQLKPVVKELAAAITPK